MIMHRPAVANLELTAALPFGKWVRLANSLMALSVGAEGGGVLRLVKSTSSSQNDGKMKGV